MSGGFSNTILGGATKLIRAAIQSPNFVHNVSGWSIFKNGNAEFNGVTIRGTLLGTNYVVNSSGFFFYSGTPATGNLFVSITNGTGNDGLPGGGNAYLDGVTGYTSSGGTFYATKLNGPGSATYTSASASGPYQNQAIISIGTSPSFDLQIQSSLGNIILDAIAAGKNILIPSSNPILAEISGGVVETWHNFGTPQNGFTVGNRFRYKLLADSGLVLIDLLNGVLPGAGNPVDATVIYTAANGLAIGYRPLVAFRVSAKNGTGGGSESSGFEFETDGSVQIFGVGGTTITRLDGQFLISTI